MYFIGALVSQHHSITETKKQTNKQKRSISSSKDHQEIQMMQLPAVDFMCSSSTLCTTYMDDSWKGMFQA